MKDFEADVTSRVVQEINRRGIKQSQLLKLCEEAGMPVSQPDMSKIFCGKKAMNLYQLASVCKATGISADSILYQNKQDNEDFFDFHDSEQLFSSGKLLDCYRGRFHLYYLSTAIGEERMLHGILDVQGEEAFFLLNFLLNVGEDDTQKLTKKYCGRIAVSLRLGAAYLILKSEEIGELSMICLRHRNYSIREVECRAGLVLTMSAGEAKSPVAHRCLLVREKLNTETLEELRPWLQMIGEDIRVEKGKLERLSVELQREFSEYADELERIQRLAAKKEYLEFDVEMLRRQLSMNRKDFSEFLSKLYSAASAPRNYRITQTDDIRIYEKVSELIDRSAEGKSQYRNSHHMARSE